ncbi:uncharacterized protein LOC126602861 [Malus sylvestris]|uniref:uncharacterized protein LOC126602861 n=1 Tax=Malus sylvestris TaxID=3752 RepID=UPI0021ACEFFA|nr:uncharacterized protein LOC126602861 [Malus sylvestris]
MEEQSERRTRGACIPKWKGKQVCLFDSTWKCVSENSSDFSKMVASEVKDPRHIPLKKDWRGVPANAKELMWEIIKGNILFLDEDQDRMPIIRNMTLNVADHAYKEYRNWLKAEYYTKRQEHERSEPPPGVDGGQWAEMLAYWDDPKTKEVAEKNKINRVSKKMNHTTGSKTFARVREELKKKHGKEPDPITFFRATHTRKDDTWIDESSQQRGISMESQVQSIVESGEEDTSEIRTHIYVEQMGSETRNRVRGYGHGVISDMVSYASSSDARASRKSSKGALARMVAKNNKLRRREEEASKLLAAVTVELQQSKESQNQVNQQQQAMMQQLMMQQQQLFMMLIPQHLQRPPLSPPASQHSAPNQPPASAYPMQHMSFQPQYPTPVYRPQMASPGDHSHISPGVFNAGLSSGLLSGMMSGSLDGDLLRYLGAHAGLAEGVGGVAEGAGAQGGPAEGSGSVE